MPRVWKFASKRAKPEPAEELDEPKFSLFKRVCGEWVRVSTAQYPAKSAVFVWGHYLTGNSGYCLDMVRFEAKRANTRGNKHYGRVTLKQFDKVADSNLAASMAAEFKVGGRIQLSTDPISQIPTR